MRRYDTRYSTQSVVEDSERKDVATDHDVETTLTRSNTARAHARAHDVGEGEQDEKASLLQDTSERVPPVGVRQNEDSAAQEDKGRVLRN